MTNITALLNQTLPTNMEAFRRARRMSQHELGRLVNKTQAQISHYENGMHVPESETLNMIAQALDFPLDPSKLTVPYCAADFESIEMAIAA